MAEDFSAGADIGSSGDSGGTFSSDFLGSIFGSNTSSSSVPASSSAPAKSGMDGNSLIAALGGDVAKGVSAFFVADAAKTAVKKNPASATTLILVVGGVAALIVVMLLVRK